MTLNLPSGGDSPRNVARTVNLLSQSIAEAQALLDSIIGLTDGDKGDITVASDGTAWTINAGAVGSTELADDGVTDAKLRESAALTVIGRAANSTGNPADIAAGTNGHLLGRLSNALGFSSVSAFLDVALGSTQGMVMYRGSSTWDALATSTANYVLSTGGAAANPSWRRPPNWIRHAIVGTTSGSTQSTTSIPACSAIMLVLNGVSHSSGSNQSIRVALSSNNGSSYGTARNISASAAASVAVHGQVWIMEVGVSGNSKDISPNTGPSGAGSTYRDLAVESTVTGVIDALQFSPSGGNFDAGAIVVYYA